MNIVERVKGLIVAPENEWTAIDAENTSVAELYRNYIVYLAAIPPFASFVSGYLFGFRGGAHVGEHLAFFGGLARAVMQYSLSLPLIYMVAFVISNLAPHFDGRESDRRSLALVAYSATPAWLASAFALIPFLRWLDLLGLYGLWVFYTGFPRMLRCPKDHADIFTLIVLVLTIVTGAIHAFLVRLAVPAPMLYG